MGQDARESAPWLVGTALAGIGVLAALGFSLATGSIWPLLLVLGGIGVFLLLWTPAGKLIKAWSIPVLILTLPLEISKLWIPLWRSTEDVGGQSVSVIDAARLAIAFLFIVWVIAAIKGRRLIVPWGPIGWLSGLLLGEYLLSLWISPNRQRALIEIVRLATFVLLLDIVVLFLADMRAIIRAVRTLVACGVVLGTLGIYQFISRSLFWNQGLIANDVVRVNVTFGDPNHLGRFLAIIIIFAFLAGRHRLMNPWLAYVTAIVCFLTLFFTLSRSSWVALALAGGGLVLLSSGPKRGLLLPLLGFGTLAALLLALLPQLSARFATLGLGAVALGKRMYLISAGWDMFLRHPLLGVGIGGFQSLLVTDYSHYIWQGASVTASHTSIITIAAELGVLGLLLTLGLLVHAFRCLRSVRSPLASPLYAIALASWLGVMIIFACSQSEGRFYEDPYLWLLLGLLAATQRLKRTYAHAHPAH